MEDAAVWDALLDDPDVLVVDARNKYEVDVGTFEGAVSPNTDNFRQFPDWMDRLAERCRRAPTTTTSTPASDALDEHERERCVVNGPAREVYDARTRASVPDADMPVVRRRPKAVAMFCTGGIRCEKSTSYAVSNKLFGEDIPVYHLAGGVLAYLDARQNPNNEGGRRWKGECYVFDRRVAVTHGLRPSNKWRVCPATRRPVRQEEGEGEKKSSGDNDDVLSGAVASQKADDNEDERSV